MVRDFYREGWIFSLAVHVGLAVALIVGLPQLRRPRPEIPEVIPVEFVTIDDVVRTPVKEPEPTSEAPAVEKVVEAAPPPRPQAEAAVPMPDARPPEPQSKPPAPRPRLQVTPRSKPKPPARFDPGRVAALLDRSIRTAAPEPAATPEEKPEKEAAPTPRQSALAARIATATLAAAIRQRVQQCWFVPAGAKDLEKMQVRIRIELRRDGRLARPPQFIDAGNLSAPGREFYRIFAESARRAVLNCQPYDNLPLTQYELWRQIEFTFDAGEMLGG